jgi:AbrB family looped-hinge helix DNA binding protein
MTATLTLDNAGRLLLPKRMREQLKLRSGAKMKVEIVGDKIQIEEEVQPVEWVRNKSGRRVVVGWEGFDAAAAVRATHEDLAQRGLNAST